MVINNLIDLIEKLFGGDYGSIMIVEGGEWTEKPAEQMTIKELKKYDISKIESIYAEHGTIYFKF